ncbi:MAG: DUF5119 domain-containing protein [Rikenellaceae bacterium]
MKRYLLILTLLLSLVSCERRELTYLYSPTVSVQVNADWSNLDEAPTGMSVYFYPTDGGTPTVVQTNNTSTATANLGQGTYNILVFNQIPTDYGTITFSGMDSFSTAEVKNVSTKSTWATTKSDDDYFAREPEEIAVSTYEGFVVTEEAIYENIELRSKNQTKADEEPYAIFSFTPRVVIKTTRVRIRVSGIDNHRSTRATLYGMATGYHFSGQASHSTMTTHLLETWSVTTYDDDSSQGELIASFTSFGLPEQSTTTRGVEQWDDWEGRLDIEVLLVDNETVVSESVALADKITASADSTKSDEDVDADIDTDINTDIDTDLDLDFDLTIDWGFDDDDNTSDPIALTLPDVVAEGSVEGGFSATVDDWGDELEFDIIL